MDGLRQRHAVAADAAPPNKGRHVEDDSSSSSGSEAEELATFTPPSFTIKELLGAIPQHCYERSAIRSGAYIVMDFAFIGACVYAATFINGLFGRDGSLVAGVAGQLARYAAWAVYAFAAGLPGTGVWVIAHECGHQSFSESKTINNTVGWILHSALLVPYHSWRISHAKHHAATGHMTRDQVWVPKTRSQRGIPSEDELAQRRADAPAPAEPSLAEKLDDLFEDAPLYNVLNIVLQQLVGWPAYLITNATGPFGYPKWTTHFDPESALFDKRNRRDILVSDLGLAIAFAALGAWAYYRGVTEVARLYVAPWLWVNHWLVLITYLQHTDPKMPHYRDPEWNFQRGALCTIDRHCFGFFMHGIAETHVVHHLCSKIPHYNAWDAREALKPVLGKYYVFDDTPVFKALYDNYRACRFVDDEGDVIFYRDTKGKVACRVAYDQPVSDSGVDVKE